MILDLGGALTKSGLTDEQKKNNREKSKTRCLAEHVFGFMEQSMCGLIFRRVGEAKGKGGCRNDLYSQ
jgi:hypothetical protein